MVIGSEKGEIRREREREREIQTNRQTDRQTEHQNTESSLERKGREFYKDKVVHHQSSARNYLK